MSNNTKFSVSEPRDHYEVTQGIQSASMRSLLVVILTAFLVPLVTMSVFRLYIHPLRKIPGQRLAAMSKAYGFYFNYIQEGGYSKKFKGLHEKYSMWRSI